MLCGQFESVTGSLNSKNIRELIFTMTTIQNSIDCKYIGNTSESDLTKKKVLRLEFLIKRHNRLGEGVFTRIDLPRGTVVLPNWNESFYRGIKGWVCLDRKSILRSPSKQLELFFKYGLDVNFDCIIGPVNEKFVTTIDNFINHSCSPNLQFDNNDNVVAAVKINKGDELLIDYGFFSVNFDERFECRCGASNCRGRVMHNDWQFLSRLYGYNLPTFLHPWIKRLSLG
jgi:uncharacterized protein